MQFLALMKINEEGLGSTNEENFKILNEKIVPGIKVLKSWELDGKLRGGFFHGQRSAVMIIEAESLEALDSMMETIHLNGVFDADIIELQSISDALKTDESLLISLKSNESQ